MAAAAAAGSSGAAAGGPKLVIHTFGTTGGRAEILRLMLKEVRQPFTEVNVEYKEWTPLKSKYPFGQLPVLEIDGVFLPQSAAMERWAARTFNLYGANVMESARVDVIVEALKEYAHIWAQFNYTPDVASLDQKIAEAKNDLKNDAAALKAKLEELENQKLFAATKPQLGDRFKSQLPFWMTKLEEHLKMNQGGAGFFVGGQLTYADVMFTVFTRNNDMFRSFVEKSALLNGLYVRVMTRPAFVAHYPATPPAK